MAGEYQNLVKYFKATEKTDAEELARAVESFFADKGCPLKMRVQPASSAIIQNPAGGLARAQMHEVLWNASLLVVNLSLFLRSRRYVPLTSRTPTSVRSISQLMYWPRFMRSLNLFEDHRIA